LGIFFLGLEEILVPLLVEFLVLFDVSLFTFILLLGLITVEFTSGVLVVLTLKLGNSVFGHFGFHILALLFALFLMLLKHSDKIVNIF